MKPLSDKERLVAALIIARSLHEDVGRAEGYPTKTCITPVGTEDGKLYVTIKTPRKSTRTEMERVSIARTRRVKGRRIKNKEAACA